MSNKKTTVNKDYENSKLGGLINEIALKNRLFIMLLVYSLE